MRKRQPELIEMSQCETRTHARWDGLHGVITNLQNIPAMELLARYRGL